MPSSVDELFPGLASYMLCSENNASPDGQIEGTRQEHALTYADEKKLVERWLQSAECLQSADTATLLSAIKSHANDFVATGFSGLQELTLASIHDSNQDLQTQWACSELTEFLASNSCNLSPSISDHTNGLLLFFGFGHADLMTSIIQAVKPRIVLIFEPNKELLSSRISSEACEQLLQAREQFNAAIILVTDSDIIAAELKAKNAIETINFSCQERLFAIQFRELELFSSLMQKFCSGDSFLRDLRYRGFFVDELHMLLNASISFMHCPPRLISYSNVASHQCHAVITASGPSIEQSLPLLQENRNQFDLFSCYSTLGSLLQAHIKPDYHCNQERHACHLPILADEQARSYARQGILLCSANNDPRMNALYRDSVAFFRSASSASAMYARHVGECISAEGPQVANLALYYAILLGYRTIHLFGVDLGSTNQNQVRAQCALSHSHRVLDKQVPGNRQDYVWADQPLIESAEYMGYLLSGVALPEGKPIEELKVYNYSDGQRIPGTISSDPTEFYWQLSGSNREIAPLQLISSLRRIDRQVAIAQYVGFDFRYRLSEYMAAIRPLLAQPFSNKAFETFLQFSERHSNRLKDQVTTRLMSGSLTRIWHTLLMINARITINDKATALNWKEKAASILEASAASMESLALEMAAYIESIDSVDSHVLKSTIFKPVAD